MLVAFRSATVGEFSIAVVRPRDLRERHFRGSERRQSTMDRLTQYIRNAVYVVLVLLISPWLILQSIRNGKYREGFAAKFLGRVPVRNNARPCIWLHAVSVGEVNIVATLIPMLRQRWPGHDLYITTTTTSGYRLARKKFAEWKVSYAPLDFSWAIRTAMQRIRPSALILMELELWPNLIGIASGQSVPVAIVNGRLSEKSHAGYQRIRRLIAPSLHRVDLIAAQNDEYASRFLSLGARANRVMVTGNVKFDSVEFDRSNPRTESLRRLAGIGPAHRVFVAGSTQAPEEQVALAAWQRVAAVNPDLWLLIVPRHPERFDEVARLLDESGLPWRRRSQVDGKGGDVASRLQPAVESLSRILLVDTIGELAAWWGVADVAFVGGSLGDRGGQNMIEPAAFGAAVCFGPNTKNFRDVTESLIAGSAAAVVRDANGMATFLGEHLTDRDANPESTMGGRASRLVQSQAGATEATGDALARFVLPNADVSTGRFDAPLQSFSTRMRA